MYVNLYLTYKKLNGWIGAPEFLKSLANLFNDKEIANDFEKYSQNYLVSFEAPIEKIHIEGFDKDISIKEKTSGKYLNCNFQAINL